jgi:DNA-binding transcriptional regulator YdaS (Cro superfamily)
MGFATMTRYMLDIWLGHVRALKLAESDRAAAKLIGVLPQTISHWRKKGTPHRMADLACAAVIEGLAPYGEIEARTEREAAE